MKYKLKAYIEVLSYTDYGSSSHGSEIYGNIYKNCIIPLLMKDPNNILQNILNYIGKNYIRYILDYMNDEQIEILKPQINNLIEKNIINIYIREFMGRRRILGI